MFKASRHSSPIQLRGRRGPTLGISTLISLAAVGLYLSVSHKLSIRLTVRHLYSTISAASFGPDGEVLAVTASKENACQSQVSQAVSLDGGRDVSHAFEQIKDALTCFQEGAAAAAAALQDAFLVVPLMWYFEARQQAFKHWYRNVFDVHPHSAIDKSGEPGSVGRRAINISKTFPRRGTNIRFGANPVVLHSPGAAATQSGVLVSPSIYLTHKFAVRLNVEHARRLLVTCADAQFSGTLECDSEAVWSPGYGVASVAPMWSAFPSLISSSQPPNNSESAVRGDSSLHGITGSPLWDAVWLRGYACEVAKAGTAAGTDSGTSPRASNGNAGSASAIAETMTQPDDGWISHACFMAGYDSIAVLAAVSAGGADPTQRPKEYQLLRKQLELIEATGGGGVPLFGAVHRLMTNGNDGSPPAYDVDAAAAKWQVMTSMPELRRPPWAPSRTLTFVDAYLVVNSYNVMVLRHRRSRQQAASGAASAASAEGAAGLQMDQFVVEDCTSPLRMDGQWVKNYYPAAASLDHAKALTQSHSGSGGNSKALPVLPRATAYSHGLALNNYYHSFEGSSPLYQSVDYAAAAGDFAFGVHSFNAGFMRQIAESLGLSWANKDSIVAWYEGRLTQKAAEEAAASSANGTSAAMPAPSSPSTSQQVPPTAVGLFPSVDVNGKEELFAVRTELALLVEGPFCQWPGVIAMLTAREKARARLGLPPADLSAYWPDASQLASSASGAALLERARASLPSSSSATGTSPAMPVAAPAAAASVAGGSEGGGGGGGPVSMSEAAKAFGCPAALSRPPSILVVSRGGKKRPLKNEGDVVQAINRMGGSPRIAYFKDGQLPAMTEAWRLFGSADVVISPHGAGLTNIFAMRPGAALFEWAPFKFRYYGMMAAVLNVDWHVWEYAQGDHDPVVADVRNFTLAYCGHLAQRLRSD